MLIEGSRALQVAKKGLKSHEEPEEQAAGAKALVDFAALAARDPEGTPVVP
jgi:hypothetical protein